jgi:hypothetical protein
VPIRAVESHVFFDCSATKTLLHSTRECVVNIEKVPGDLETALSSLFVESRNDGEPNAIELCIGLAIGAAVDDAGAFTSAFDVDGGFLAGFCKSIRVTQLMFWPQYLKHAFTDKGKVPDDARDGTPMW